MSLRDRLRQFFSRQPTIDEDETEEEQDKELVEQFHERIEMFEQSAEELFETDEEASDEEHIEVATPEYDVGEVKIEEALLSEESKIFPKQMKLKFLMSLN